MEQEERAEFLFKHPEIDLTGLPSLRLRERCKESSSDGAPWIRRVQQHQRKDVSCDSAHFDSEVFQSKVDPEHAIQQSHRYYTLQRKLSVSSTTSTAMPIHIHSLMDNGSAHSSTVSIQLSAVALSLKLSLSDVELLEEYLIEEYPSWQAAWLKRQVELATLAAPSTHFPIAPDGKENSSMEQVSLSDHVCLHMCGPNVRFINHTYLGVGCPLIITCNFSYSRSSSGRG